MTTLRQKYIEEMVLRGLSERTQEAYVHQVYHLAKYYHRSPDGLSEQEVHAYLVYLAQERHLSASSINQAVNAFRFFYQHVCQRKLELVQAAMPYGRRAIVRPQVFSIEELEKLFTVGCVHPRDRALLMTVYGGGLRVNEACHLKVADLLGTRHQIRVVQGKGKKDRYTILSPQLLQELRQYWQLFRVTDWLFPASVDPQQPMIDATAQRIFNRAVQRAGLPRRGGIHSLRNVSS
ncbi:MAG: site-specific integrase [Verrucomicrobiota bacterium]|jgi:site-specific recombinase XerD